MSLLCAGRLLASRRAAIPLYRCYSVAPPKPSSLNILGKDYKTDDWTNAPPSILSRIGTNLHSQSGHPLNTLRSLIHSAFPGFQHVSPGSPLVTPYQNFDSLSFAPDHPGRSRSDTYYVNKDLLLRTHTSAHEVEIFKSGSDKWTLTADVYRRDEIDSSHYPVFHQTEGARTFDLSANTMNALREENAALSAKLSEKRIIIEDVPHISPANPVQNGHNPEHVALIAHNLKLHINQMLLALFGPLVASTGEPLRVRWIEAFFPFTSPSFEVEVWFGGRWLEILGSGVIQQATLTNAGQNDRIGWAFGLGLERIAMVVFQIPDIRLFWSKDPRFLGQWKEGEVGVFQPFSAYPKCYKDLSFWLPGDGMHDNDFCDLVRDIAGDLVENVELIDAFSHPKTGRSSKCFRINYCAMDRNLTNDEANALHERVISKLKSDFAIEIR